MARPGPAPTPTHLRVVRGVRTDRINKSEPQPKQNEPKCPTWMSREAKAVWKRTAEQLRTMGLLFEADQDVLAAYVAAVVNFQKATKIVDTEGVVVEGRRDGMVTNPAVRVQRDAAQQIRMLAGELGLTPASRTRLKAEETSDDSDILD